MTRTRRNGGHRGGPSKGNRGKARPVRRTIHLESGTIESLRLQLARGEDIRAFAAAYFGSFASQRAEIRDKLTRVLAEVAEPREISRWQRAIRLKHTLTPLSARGSVLNRVGGRFNFGRIDERRFSAFPALYLASDRATALQERLGESRGTPRLTPLELALQDTTSISVVSISGRVEITLDISKNKHLQPFLEETRDFTVPQELATWAERLGLNPPSVAQSIEDLRREIQNPNWRQVPAAFGHPSNSQVFGELAMAAGIEAIVFPSSKSNQSCLAVFPQNFANSDAFLALDDDPPDGASKVVTRLDKNTWHDLV